MITGYPEEVVPLLLSLCKTCHDRVNITDGSSFDSNFERIHEFLGDMIKHIQTNIAYNGLARIGEAELAAVWGAVICFPYFKVDSSLLFSFKNTLRQHLATSDGKFFFILQVIITQLFFIYICSALRL